MDYKDLAVIYEDNHIIVVIKPQNIPSQSDISSDVDLLSVVKEYLKVTYSKPGNVFAGLVHRLDRPTGGVMVFAKTSKAASRLSEQIREGNMEKRYLAVTYGCPLDRKGRLTDYLVKDEKNNKVTIVPAKLENAKQAVLDYSVKEVYENYSLIDIDLITGRSHQARVQLSGIGCPIWGDVKYGAKATGNLALWAYSLKFLHPITHQSMVFKVFPPMEKAPWKYFRVEKYINVTKPE